MPIYMYQASYTPESWAAQMKNPSNRIATVGKKVCEAAGGKMIGGWYAFGEHDLVLIADLPDDGAMAAVAIAVGAGGAIKSARTTVLMTGEDGAKAIGKAAEIAGSYAPAR